MKMIMNVILVVLAFTWISSVSADKGAKKPSPESILSCIGARINGDPSLPETINKEECPVWDEGCATCLISLENQGCKVIDTVVTHFYVPPRPNIPGDLVTSTTYLLSCVKP